MANFGINNALGAIKSKAIQSVTQYLGIDPASDVIMSPIYTSRDMSSDYFLVKIHSVIPKDDIIKDITFRIPEKFSIGLKATFSSLVEGKMGIVSTLNKLIQAGSSLSGSMLSLNTKFTTSQIWEGSAPVSITLPIELNANQDINKDVFDKVIQLSSMVLPKEGKNDNWFDMFLRAPGPTPINLAADPTLRALSNENSDTYKAVENKINSGGTNEDITVSGITVVKKESLLKSKEDAKKDLNAFSAGIKWLEKQDPGENIDITIGRILTFTRCIITDIKWDFDCTRLLNGSGLPMRVSGNLTFKTSTAMTAQDFEKALSIESTPLDLLSTIDSSMGMGGHLKNFVNSFSTNNDEFKDL